MEIKEINGDLLTSTANVIVHQVNCQGAMNSGVAKQVRRKWPIVFNEYKNYLSISSDNLGICQMVKVDENKYVANLFAEDHYGYDGSRYTDYEALYKSLEVLNMKVLGLKLKTIALPYKMSSDRGGADWDVVLAMIKSVFKNTDVTIEIWKLI